MSDLRAPLKDVAPASIDEVTVLRIWRAVGRRRAGRVPFRLRAAIAIAACMALAIAILGVRFAWRRDAGPLHRAGGSELAAIEAPERTTRVPLEDGSAIVLAPGARLVTLANDGASLVALLEAGRVSFDVRPGGPRRWTIECGLATVEVVGTRFSIERAPGRARVEVEHGIVLVRGELVKDRIQRLSAGESLDLEEVAAVADAGAPPIAPVPIASTLPSASAAKDPAIAPAEARPEWRALAQKGAYKEAYGAIAPFGVAREVERASADDLFLLADVARLSGHPAEAVAPLSRVIREHGGDARAPVAAFTLGRVQLDSLGQAAAAADTFARAIAMGLPQGLREDAFARVVEARARAGDSAGARAAAAEYEARYPNGGRLAQVRAWANRE